MTLEEHLLIHVIEECAEVQQRISKAMRFGMDQVQQAADDKPEENPERLNNKERILAELNDLYGTLQLTRLWLPNAEAMMAKQKKVLKYLKLCEKLGTLEPQADTMFGDFLRRQKQQMLDADD